MRKQPWVVKSLWLALFLGVACLPGCRGRDQEDPVIPAVAIATQPADQVVFAGATATFQVVATHATEYQWERSVDGGASFLAVSGATAASYTTPATTLADDGRRFRVVVGNAAGRVTSVSALLTVGAAPAAPQITGHPADASVVAPNTASFSVTVTGTPAPTLQWQRSLDGGGHWDDIPGATASSYTTPATGGADHNSQFRAIATNASGTAASQAATLTVTLSEAPAFTTQPADASVNAGQSAQFSVVATGVPTPLLQWQKSTDSGSTWSDISGATSATYSTGATAAGDHGSWFRAVATNSAGSAQSQAAKLTVTTSYAWGPAPNLRFVDVGNTTQYAQYVDFAMNETGDAIAIWLQHDGTRSNLWANRFVASTKAWGAPQLIEGSNEDIAQMTNPLEGPRVAINADGSAVAVWVHAPSNFVWANHFTVAGGWGTAQAIDTTGSGHSHVPRVAIDGSGDAIAVWHRYDGAARYDIWANRRTVAGGWGGPARLENDDTQSAVYPSVAMNAAGKAVVAWNWLANNLADYKDVAASYYDGGGWGGVVNLSGGAGSAGTSAKPEVGLDANGHAMVAWKQVDSGQLHIRAARYAGAWEASTVLSSPSAPALGVHLALNATGEAIATWYQLDASSNPDTYASRFKPGVGWGAAALVEAFPDPSAISPQAAIDPSGNAMVLMGRITSARPGRLVANRAPAGGDWGAEAPVDGVSYPNAPASWRLGMDGSGRAMALWVQEGPSGGYFRVYYNRYE